MTMTRRRLRAMYEVAWQVAVGSAIAIGLCSILRASAGAALSVWLIVAMITAIVWGLRDVGPDFDLRRASWIGAQSGVVAVASIGLIELVDATAFGIIAILVVASPRALTRLTARFGLRRPQSRRATIQRLRQSERAPNSGLESVRDLPITDTLSDEDLCLAWRSSFVALSRATTTEARIRAVEVRAVILDELDRRNDRGLRSWLGSGARAAGDPRRHLSEPGR